MNIERRIPMSISFRPSVLRALRHYVRFKTVEGTDLPGQRFGFSSAANDLLERALTQRGFNPRTLRLIGGSR